MPPNTDAEIATADALSQLLNMDESTADSEVSQWRLGRLFRGIPDGVFKIGSLGQVHYAVYIYDLGVDFPVDEEGHESRENGPELSPFNRCLCRVNDDGVVSHSKACADHTAGTSFDDDIGRCFHVGSLRWKDSDARHWEKTPFVVVKSLTEGGLWIVASPSFVDDDLLEEDWFTEPRSRARDFKGVGPISYARLPDSISSRLLKPWEYEAKSNKANRVEIENEHEAENVANNEEFALKRQYLGGFLLWFCLELC
ncbi:MAG: hypothetical protein M1820_003872 [Bogoriella megaspora]|nr:MAG: hypothetical protein M1820_003872 [Bogoriella megaspora]